MPWFWYPRKPDRTAEYLDSRHRLPRFSRKRQAPMRDRNAMDENTVRTPFQKSHGTS